MVTAGYLASRGLAKCGEGLAIFRNLLNGSFVAFATTLLPSRFRLIKFPSTPVDSVLVTLIINLAAIHLLLILRIRQSHCVCFFLSLIFMIKEPDHDNHDRSHAHGHRANKPRK